MRRFWHLIWYKSLAELKAENTRHYAGYLWWILTPLLQLGVYFIIFGFFRQRGQDFVSFLFVGIVFYNWFSGSVLRSSGSLLVAGKLTSSVDIHKGVFPLSDILVNSVKTIPVIMILVLFLTFRGYAINVTYLALPVLILIEGLFVIGVSVLAAAIVPFMPDLKEIIGVIIRLMFFASGVIIPLDRLGDKTQSWLYLNPMARFIEQFRMVMLDGQWPDWTQLYVPIAISAVLLLGSFIFINTFNRLYPKYT